MACNSDTRSPKHRICFLIFLDIYTQVGKSAGNWIWCRYVMQKIKQYNCDFYNYIFGSKSGKTNHQRRCMKSSLDVTRILNYTHMITTYTRRNQR